MSSAKSGLSTSLALAALLLAGCATTDETADMATQTSAPPAQMAPAEAREAANRAPPLERANFWAREHSKDPTDLDTALRFGEALFRLGSHDRVIEIARQTGVIHPDSAQIRVLLGRALAAENRHEEARAAFQAALELSPDNADALAALGLVHDRLGEHRAAQTAYRQALDIDPDRMATRSNLGLSLALTGELAAAEAELRAAMALPGAGSQVQQNLALVLGLQGRFDEMREISAGAPDEVIEQNIEALKALRGSNAEPGAPAGPDDVLRGPISNG